MKLLLERFRKADEACADAPHPLSLMLVIQGAIIRANACAHKLFGYPDGAMEGMAVEKLIPSDVREFHRDLRASMPNYARIVTGAEEPLRGVRADGSEFAVHTLLLPVDTDRGRCTLCVNYLPAAHPSGERVPEYVYRAVERILADDDQMFYVIRGGVAVLDQRQVAYLGEAARTITGVEPTEFRKDANLWISLIHPDDVGAMLAKTVEVLETGEMRNRRYRIRHTGDGEYRWIEDRVSPEYVLFGKPNAVFGLARVVNSPASQ